MKNIFGRVGRKEKEIASIEAFEQNIDTLAELTNHPPRERERPGSRIILPESAILGLAVRLPMSESHLGNTPKPRPLEPVIPTPLPSSPNDQLHRYAS